MAEKKPINYSICKSCETIVPTTHEEQEGKMYLVKQCPSCGVSRALVSTDAERYKQKRELCGYKGEAQTSCSLRCLDCDHGKIPSLVFLDVTNRCNMNCPICLANIPAMGFRFDPSMEYFEKVFKKLGTINPKPKVQLFGGEPTAATGISFGIERIVDIIESDETLCKAIKTYAPTIQIVFDTKNYARIVPIAEKLRAAKVRVDYDLSQRALGKQFKVADQNAASYALVIGQEELESGMLSLKDMATGKQQRLTIDTLIQQFSQHQNVKSS